MGLALVSQNDDGKLGVAVLADDGARKLGDGGVDATAETTVAGDYDDELLAVLGRGDGLEDLYTSSGEYARKKRSGTDGWGRRLASDERVRRARRRTGVGLAVDFGAVHSTLGLVQPC